MTRNGPENTRTTNDFMSMTFIIEPSGPAEHFRKMDRARDAVNLQVKISPGGLARAPLVIMCCDEHFAHFESRHRFTPPHWSLTAGVGPSSSNSTKA